jgi:hypothetical protein
MCGTALRAMPLKGDPCLEAPPAVGYSVLTGEVAEWLKAAPC